MKRGFFVFDFEDFAPAANGKSPYGRESLGAFLYAN